MSQSAEHFTVQGVTGVDLLLDIAGPGSRAYAFIIDWHFRVVLAAAWLIVGLLITQGALHFAPGMGAWAEFGVMVPAFLIYFLWHPVLELLLRGQSPGKRIAGVRVVTRHGGQPSSGAVLIRNVFRMIDALPVFYSLGLVCTMVSRQRVRIGDMAAGTVLVSVDVAAARSLERLALHGAVGGIDPTLLDLIDQLLERWHALDRVRRLDMGRALLARAEPDAARKPAELDEHEVRDRLRAVSTLS